MYGGPQRQYTNIYYITAFFILVHKHIHWLCEYIYQYNKIYTSTTIYIPVQKCSFQYKNILKLQYGKISPILSTQITAPVQKIIHHSVQKHRFQNKHIHRLCDYIPRYSVCIPVQKYKSQYRNKSCGTKKNIIPRPLDKGNAALA